MSTDLTLAHARADRDALADRTDVLDKVGVLRMLPDDFHVLTESVAEFYEVNAGTIRALVLDNRDELESDGYRVVTRSAFEASYPKQLTSSASRIAVFPRRAVLRVGMLLRDSPVARQVRDMLLDAERPALSEDEIIRSAVAILDGRVRSLTATNQALTAKIAEDASKVNYVEQYVADADLLKLRTVAAANDVGEDWLRDLLVDKGWIYFETETRWSDTKQCKETRRRYSAYAHKRPYFRPVEVHEAPRFRGEVMHTLKVTPAGAEAIARLITRERAA
ncbi:phage antirepressor KilAC domain-containing protein [Nocardia farcinica]|uniref:phage antirepressor KilAC domain-containing protein n=1 Tax=Nocardia farcinica TaxID=37329 RepID=UPI002456EB57|nr:phage antirepressor KilAC domain-containing protein [Nocardia farcinica]